MSQSTPIPSLSVSVGSRVWLPLVSHLQPSMAAHPRVSAGSRVWLSSPYLVRRDFVAPFASPFAFIYGCYLPIINLRYLVPIIFPSSRHNTIVVIHIAIVVSNDPSVVFLL